VTAPDTPRTDPQAFLNATGSVPVGNIDVAHTNPDTNIEDVTFRFRVQKASREESGVAPSAVVLYRDQTAGWARLPTDRERT
jgi:PGF-pre-PGF domain-containing protein